MKADTLGGTASSLAVVQVNHGEQARWAALRHATRPCVLLIGVVLAGCEANFHEDPERDDRVEWGTTDLPHATCVGDGDGVIGTDELMVDPQLGIGTYVTVNVGGSSVALADPAGTDGGDGLVWDLSAVDPERDELLRIGPTDLDTLWYEAHFPADAFTALLDGPAGVWGVYRMDEDAGELLLLGIATEAEGDHLVYDPPVALLRLPLADGDAWFPDDAEAVGLVGGESYPRDLGDEGIVSLVHTYDIEVEGSGTVRLPFGDLPALRVRVAHRQEAYNSIAGLFAADASRMTLFVSECLGMVARLRSTPDEIDPDFTEASEVMRLGFDPEMLP